MWGINDAKYEAGFRVFDYPVDTVVLQNEYLVRAVVIIIENEFASLVPFFCCLGDVENAFVKFCSDCNPCAIL